MEKFVKKFIVQFSYISGKSCGSYCGVAGWSVVNGSRRFSLQSDTDLAEKAQKVWELISEKYRGWEAPESLRAPKFLALKELHTTETVVDWQP